MEVIENQGDHSDMSSKEMEDYLELLRQLEPMSKEESDNSFKDKSYLVLYF